MTRPTFSHVVFDHIHPAKEVSVPLEAAASYYAVNPITRIVKVHNGDPAKFSWAKSWSFAHNGELARIGAGAYGDCEVWRHPRYDALSLEALRATGAR